MTTNEEIKESIDELNKKITNLSTMILNNSNIMVNNRPPSIGCPAIPEKHTL